MNLLLSLIKDFDVLSPEKGATIERFDAVLQL